MSTIEIPPIKSAKVLRLQPGDTLVISVDTILSAAQRDFLQPLFEAEFPGTKCFIADRSVKLSVLRPGETLETA